MKKRITAIVLCILMLVCVFPTEAFAAQNETDIVILYENDVHCALEGYSKLSAMKKELQQTYANVGVVSGGDYISGSSLGSVSQGEYIINLVNLVGYDALTLGNHEFDYRLTRLEELVAIMDTRPICCNFKKLDADVSYFEPYSIVSYGDVDVAYIGITTPSAITSAFPGQFKDEKGEYIYTFQPTALYDVVQSTIDTVKAAGVDYIIALSHIGYEEGNAEDVQALIRNTSGLDVVLDAHSHSVIEGKTVADESGNDVLLSSTGTKFEHIGKLTLSDGTCKTELIKTADYQNTDPAIDAYIEEINAEYAVLGERKVAFSEVALNTHDAEGNRLVRKAETNLGDLCAEAFRSIMGADISYMNGGGIRANIEAGDVTFNDVLSVMPFNNTVVLAEVTGQTIKDMLEMSVMNWPEEDGSFPHVAGITFSVNTSIPTSVTVNELEEFSGVPGQYRVYDIKVLNNKTGKYVPIDLKKTYTIASHNYALLEQGSGMKMLENAVILKNEGLLDVQALEQYIVDNLNGTIGQDYAEVKTNITFTEGEVITVQPVNPTIWIICAAAALVLILLIVLLAKRSKRNKTAA